MDREHALQLVAPLAVGETIVDGWTLDAVELRPAAAAGDEAVALVSGDLQVVLRARSDRPAWRRTTHHDVLLEHAGASPGPERERAAEALVARIEANDRPPPTAVWRERAAESPSGPSGAVLWLVPGHIGNPLDLSVRALQVLGAADRLYVEEADVDGVRSIYADFALGPVPELVPLHAADLEASLRDGLARGLSLALFGANEGAPAVCDPGWRLLVAARAVPDLAVRSLSGGSALVTALMHHDRRDDAFEFCGLFREETGESPFLERLARLRPDPRSKTPSLLCLAQGRELRAAWPDLVAACRGLSGRIRLFRDLTMPTERVDGHELAALPAAPDLGDDDKVVVRVDVDAGSWARELVRRPARWRARWGRR